MAREHAVHVEGQHPQPDPRPVPGGRQGRLLRGELGAAGRPRPRSLPHRLPDAEQHPWPPPRTPVPAFFVATEDSRGGREPDTVTINVPGLPTAGLAQCASWAGDGSHRIPMMERANQTPALDAVRIQVRQARDGGSRASRAAAPPGSRVAARRAPAASRVTARPGSRAAPAASPVAEPPGSRAVRRRSPVATTRRPTIPATSRAPARALSRAAVPAAGRTRVRSRRRRPKVTRRRRAR